MVFSIFESSRQKGRPVSLFRITYGDAAGAQFFYTDHDTSVDKDGETYICSPMARGEIVASGTLDKANLEIATSRKNKIAELFRQGTPSYPVTLEIYLGHIGDDDWKLAWFGQIKSVIFEFSKAKLQCEPWSMRQLNAGLRRHYQVSCPHALYGQRCGAIRASFEQTATVVEVVGQTLKLSAGWNGAIDRAKFLNGILQWAGDTQTFDARMIQKVVDATHVTLDAVPRGVVVGTEVLIAPGCDHQMTDCLNLFANIHNFGGFPFIPFTDPVGINQTFGS